MKELELKLDKMAVDTTLADEFISSLKIEDYLNKNPAYTDEDLSAKIWQLSMSIELNANTFAQLEYRRRGVPLEHVLEYDVKLIVQVLRGWRRNTMYSPVKDDLCIVMDKEAILADLGHFSTLCSLPQPVHLYATRESLPVCCYFLKLCRDLGLDRNIKLALIEDDKELPSRLRLKGDGHECWGIVTQHADLDSAVDCLLESADNYPWSVTKILVQECKYEDFKNAIEWKCRDFPTSAISEDTKMKSSKHCVYKQKTLVFDYPTANCINIEAYRTSKELLNFLKERPWCLSLWSNDISETSELCYSEANTSFIWVNDQIHFQGIRTAQILYSANIQQQVYIMENKHTVDQKWKAWLQKSVENRRRMVLEASKSLDIHQELAELDIEAVDACWVERSRMCVYKSCTRVVIVSGRNYELDMARKLVGGDCVVVYQWTEFAQALYNQGAPVFCMSDSRDYDGVDVLPLFDRSKAVFMNYGTIFAN